MSRCPNYKTTEELAELEELEELDVEDCECPYCHARFLLDLSEKLRNIPGMYGTDDYHTDQLRYIAFDMSEQAVVDHNNEFGG